MNDKVYVKIRGLSAQEAGDAYKEAEDIEIISVGRYTRRAGKEYIRYEEVYDGESAKSDTLIKISEDRVEISKKGAITTIMEFIQDKKTVSCYNTPYGGLAMSIYTSMLDIERDEDKMQKMKAAVEKGFKLATKSWGKELPDISKNTYSAVMDKFDDYFASKKTSTDTE